MTAPGVGDLRIFLDVEVDRFMESVRRSTPKTVELCERAAVRLTEATRPGDFQAVALLCRDALIEFADGAFSPDFVQGDGTAPNPDQFASRLALTLAHYGDRAGSDDTRKLARTLAADVQARQHDRTTRRDEAASVLLLTAAIIVETERLLARARAADPIYERFGVYRCAICRSRALAEDQHISDDGDGYHAAGYYLICTECGWIAEER